MWPDLQMVPRDAEKPLAGGQRLCKLQTVQGCLVAKDAVATADGAKCIAETKRHIM